MESVAVDNGGIIKWSQMDVSHLDLNPRTYGSGKNFESSPFSVDPVINSRIALW